MSSLAHAAGIGLATSMRTFTPLGVAALSGLLAGRNRRVALALAGGELVYDKLPFCPARTEVPGLLGRGGGGAIGGFLLAGPTGAAVGGATGLAGAYAFQEVRKRLSAKAPAFGVALGEDALSAGLALAVLRS